MQRRIGIVIHPGFQLLDATGPIAAFEIASRFSPDGYDIELLAPTAGPVVSSSGLAFTATALEEEGFDTIIISGGELIRDMEAARAIVVWLARIRPRRLASVCSGAFLLAEAGRLDGRRATTHWDSTERFRRLYPRVDIEPDSIFTRHGDIWTSAGITAGIDLALALIEDDLGPAIAQRAAQQLVVHKRRTGGQSQFSALLELGGHSGRFEKLIAWIKANPAEPLDVEQLAGHMAMSPRNFARTFLRDVGTTPAKAVEKLRVGLAQEAVENGFGSFEQIARQSGFRDAGQMRRAFMRTLGRPPQAMRRAPQS
ncbi:MAG TPA: GlxA family transcriptional regulator [Devosia sp.]|nr:GlxA family transcriptional regulator [Devosia sp.]